MLASLAGMLTGYFYRTDTPFFLPSLQRPRRLWRPLRSWRIPLELYRLLERIFTPFIGVSQPPRRSNRVLPGQVRDAPSGSGLGFEGQGLRGLLAARAGLDVPAPPRPVMTEDDETPTPPTARGAMGEWVDEMTGRSTRAPTEQEITA